MKTYQIQNPAINLILNSEAFRQQIAKAIKEKIVQEKINKLLEGKTEEEKEAFRIVFASEAFKARIAAIK